MRRRGRTRSSSRPPPALHYLSLVCSLGLSPRLPFAHSPRASTLLPSLQPCGASRLRTSRTASPRPGSPPPAASGSPRGHVPCLCLIAPEIRVHAAGGRITRRCSRLARACSSALRAGKRAPAAERHPLYGPRQLTRSRLRHLQLDSPGHAGSALRTTGDPRRGRCGEGEARTPLLLLPSSSAFILLRSNGDVRPRASSLRSTSRAALPSVTLRSVGTLSRRSSPLLF